MTDATIEAPNAITENLDKVQTELAVIDNISAGLAELEKSHPKNLACDVATTRGMKEAIAGRAAWRAPRIATENARKAEDDRIAAQLAELAAQREAADAEQRRLDEAEIERKRVEYEAARAAEEAQHAANKKLRDAAPQMLDALRAVLKLKPGTVPDSVRGMVERAIEEATGLPA